MADNIEISVIMTARNAAPFLGMSLGSIKVQTRRADQIVFVDDGSSVETWACAQALLASVEGALLIRLPPTGRGGALNVAVEHASGAWIANVDADDWVAADWLERSVSELHSCGGYGAIGVGSRLFSDYSDLRHTEAFEQAAHGVRDVTPALAYRNPISHTGALMSRAALHQVGGYDSTRRSQLDYDLWVRLVAAGWRIGKIEAKLCARRIHPGQSFEHRRRFSYLYSSFGVQVRAIKASGAPKTAYSFAGLRFFWGLLPRRVRLRLRSLCPVSAN